MAFESFDEKLKKISLRNKTLSPWVRGVISAMILGSLALGVYYCATFSGPYRWLVYLQLNWLEEYDIVLSVVLTIFITLTPSVVLAYILSGMLTPQPSVENIPDVEPVSSPLQEKLKQVSATRPLLYKMFLLSFFIFIGGFGVSLYLFVVYGHLSSVPVRIDIASSTIVNDKTTEYITLISRLNCEEVYVLEENSNSGKSETMYIPVIDNEGEFKNIFLATNNAECIDSLVSRTGIISSGGLPDIIKEKYIEHGLISEDEEYSVIEQNFGATPEGKKGMAWMMLLVSGVFLMIFLWIRYRTKPFM